MDDWILHNMMKIAAIIIIAVGIGISACFSDKGKKKVSLVCTVIVAVLAFLGPYIVEFAEKMDEYNSIKEVMDNSLHTPPGLTEEDDEDKLNNSISDNDGTDDNKDDEPKGIYKGDMAFIIFVGESHEPSDDTNKVEVSDWIKEEDYDLLGKTYDGGVKITISNTSFAFDSDSNISMEIVSEAHYVLDTDKMEEIPEEYLRLEGKFVVEKDTNASSSTAVISILVDGEEVYDSGTINCYSANIEPVDIMLSGKKELVIRTVCQYRGEPFVVGLVDK